MLQKATFWYNVVLMSLASYINHYAMNKNDYMFSNLGEVVLGGLPLGGKHFREDWNFEDAMYNMGVVGSK